MPALARLRVYRRHLCLCVSAYAYSGTRLSPLRLPSSPLSPPPQVDSSLFPPTTRDNLKMKTPSCHTHATWRLPSCPLYTQQHTPPAPSNLPCCATKGPCRDAPAPSTPPRARNAQRLIVHVCVCVCVCVVSWQCVTCAPRPLIV
jgi:hypothetical protein